VGHGRHHDPTPGPLPVTTTGSPSRMTKSFNRL
jgi:hypothetical protein